jgi:metal transporter CNNM
MSLSKILSVIPRSFSSSAVSKQHLKRGAEWAIQMAKDKPMEPEDPPDSPRFWWKLGLSVALVLAGGVFAG